MERRIHCYRSDLPVAVAETLESLSAIGAVERGPAERTRHTYFDTFDWRLLGRGLALRESSSPALEVVDGASGRIAAMAPGTLPGGFATDLPLGGLRDTLAPVIEMRRLLPRLQVRQTAIPVTVRDVEGKAVLRARVETWHCRGAAGAGPAHRIGRVELFLVRGYGGALLRALAALEPKLQGTGALGDCLRDALAATESAPDPEIGKLRPGLTPDMTADVAARAIHHALLEALIRNEDGAAENGDSEFLHDFRVAVRRTRSALAQIDKGVLPAAQVAKAKENFRWLGRQTNRMRDLDVYLLDFPSFEAVLPQEYRAYLQPFHDHLQRESISEGGKIARLLRGRRYRRIRDTWRDCIADLGAVGPLAAVPVQDLAGQRIWKAYRRLLREGRAIGNGSPAEALHDLRITAKRLRYLLEFFGELYPPGDIACLVKPLKGLQDVLGRFQDSEVQSEKILEFAREMAAAGSVPVETHMAMGMVAESILTRRAKARMAFDASFRKFSRPKAHAMFRELFRPVRSREDTGSGR